MLFSKKTKDSAPGAPPTQNPISTADGQTSHPPDRSSTPYDPTTKPSTWQLHRATRNRQTFALLTSFFLLITVVFLILVEIGSVAIKPVLTSIWFFKLDLSNIVPASVPNALLINTIAQTLGLHDYYTVGLWNFCEGYVSEGFTDCSKPKTLYWFNPVEILLNELLSGAVIQLPSDINNALHLLRIASQWMFGFFLTGVCLSFVLMFLVPFSLYTRWATFPIAIFSFINALLITVASGIATAIFVIFKRVITSVDELNIGAEIGAKMFAFMWIASAFAIFTWIVQMGMCCCCASRRDVLSGKKTGSRKAWETSGAPPPEKSRRR